MKALFSTLLLVFLVAGCAHTPPVLLCQATIQNNTSRELRNFRIVHHPTERTLMSNQILPGSNLEWGVDRFEFKATSAILSWDDPVWGPRKTKVLIPHPPGSKTPQRLIYAIGPSGLVDVRFAPCKKGE